jgi:hypothetical protein
MNQKASQKHQNVRACAFSVTCAAFTSYILVCQISWNEIKVVQNLIERCLQQYMTQVCTKQMYWVPPPETLH